MRTHTHAITRAHTRATQSHAHTRAVTHARTLTQSHAHILTHSRAPHGHMRTLTQPHSRSRHAHTHTRATLTQSHAHTQSHACTSLPLLYFRQKQNKWIHPGVRLISSKTLLNFFANTFLYIQLPHTQMKETKNKIKFCNAEIPIAILVPFCWLPPALYTSYVICFSRRS